VLDRKPAHRYPVNNIFAGLVLVGPGQVIYCAGCQDLNIIGGLQSLGDEPAMIFGATIYFGSVPLNNYGYFFQTLFLCNVDMVFISTNPPR